MVLLFLLLFLLCLLHLRRLPLRESWKRMIRPLLAVVAEREAAAGVVDEEVAAVDAQAPCRAQAVHRPTMIGRISEQEVV